jgi:uncharacterized protein
VHISQLADRFIDDPKKVVKVGQIVKVRVLEVNESLKRVSLSMKSLGGPAKPQSIRKAAPPEKKPPSIQDLMTKFNAPKKK